MPFSHSIHDHRHIHDHDHDHHVHYHDHHHVFDHNQHGHQHLHDEYLNHITDLVPIVPVKTVNNAPANLKKSGWINLSFKICNSSLKANKSSMIISCDKTVH